MLAEIIRDQHSYMMQPLTMHNAGFQPTPSSVLHAQLSHFDEVSLANIQHVALLKRVESKYLFSTNDLPFILNKLQDHYAVLEIEGERINRYETLYFDTHDFKMYQQHHAGRADRFKVRSRTYLESDCSFLEVKHKTNRQQVIKSRIQTNHAVTQLGQQPADFVQSLIPFDPISLVPRLWNRYKRMTLVSKYSKERVTIDLNIRFDWNSNPLHLSNLVIAEVKQERRSDRSAFKDAMRQFHLRSTSFSKYCIGASLLYPHLKHNRFKAKYRLLSKLAQGKSYATH